MSKPHWTQWAHWTQVALGSYCWMREHWLWARHFMALPLRTVGSWCFYQGFLASQIPKGHHTFCSSIPIRILKSKYLLAYFLTWQEVFFTLWLNSYNFKVDYMSRYFKYWYFKINVLNYSFKSIQCTQRTPQWYNIHYCPFENDRSKLFFKNENCYIVFFLLKIVYLWYLENFNLVSVFMFENVLFDQAIHNSL